MYILITVWSICLPHSKLFLYTSKQRKYNETNIWIKNQISRFTLAQLLILYLMKTEPRKLKNHLQTTMGNIYKEIYRMFLRRVEQNKIIYQCIKP